MDPEVGDFSRGDVLIDGDTIVGVGPDLEGEGAQVIDARGFIVMPGFVDTHRHMWQGQLRRMIPNVDISMYLGLRNAFAAEYRPEDSHAGTLVTALGAVYSGVTTVQDYAHNTRSADHADAEIEALNRAGIRAVYACAPPEAGEWDQQWPDDGRIGDLVSALGALNAGVTTVLDWSHIGNSPAHADACIDGLRASGIRAVYAYSGSASELRRLRMQHFSSDDQLLTLAYATGADPAAWIAARGVGAAISLHAGGTLD